MSAADTEPNSRSPAARACRVMAWPTRVRATVSEDSRSRASRRSRDRRMAAAWDSIPGEAAMAFPAGSRWLRANPPETSMMSPRLPTPSMSLRNRTFISGLPDVEDDLVVHQLGQGAVAGAGDLEDLFLHAHDFGLPHHGLPRCIVGQGRRRGVGGQ